MDLEIADTLQTLAEISIALAGFTGIVGAIQMRAGRVFSGPEAFALWTLLVVAGLVLFASFIPSTVALSIRDEGLVWRWSFRLLLVLHAVVWWVSLPFMRRSGFLLEGFPQPQRGVALALVVLGVCTVALEVSVVLGFFTAHFALLFQLILLALLFIAFSAFVLLLVGLRGSDP